MRESPSESDIANAGMNLSVSLLLVLFGAMLLLINLVPTHTATPLRYFNSQGGLLCGDGDSPVFSMGRMGGIGYDQMTPTQQVEAKEWCKNHPNAW